MLWDSPLYMPFSWAVVLTQIGYLGWLLLGRLRAWQVGLLLVPVSGVLVPLYENWAIRAGWWHYQLAPDWVGRAALHLPGRSADAAARAGPAAAGAGARWARWALGAAGCRWVPLAGLLEGAAMLLACLVAFTIAG